MHAQQNQPPRWIIVRLGEDMNWWLEQSEANLYWATAGRSILDPRQVAYLVETLRDYTAYGLSEQQFRDAFQVFAIESEVADNRLKLVPSTENILDANPELFALPILDDEHSGPYYDFLEALGTARISRLNRTHHYVRDCTEEEMYEELNALDADRYFSAETIHAFDEISEILQWSPAEWDEP